MKIRQLQPLGSPDDRLAPAHTPSGSPRTSTGLWSSPDVFEMGSRLASGGMATGGARMPKVQPGIQSQPGLSPHLSPHVRDQAGGGGMFEHQTAQQQQKQMGGMRQEGSHSQPISPMHALPLSREQQMQGFA